MKLCVLLQKYIVNIGIYPIQPDQSCFNRRNILVSLIFGQGLILVTADVLFWSSTIREYEEAFFSWITLAVANVGLYVTIVRTRKCYEHLEHLESLIKNRK